MIYIFYIIRNLADKVATAGFYVVVPDFFHGDPATPEILETSIDEWLNKHKMVIFILFLWE
jgi:dienelactone hydrolase